MSTPFVIKINANNRPFIYDVNTSRILLVTPAMYDIIDCYWNMSKEQVIQNLSHKHAHSELEEGYQRVNELIVKHNLFSPNRLERRVGNVTEKEVTETLKREGVHQLTLEVTTSCNLRCHYCQFSGGYLNYRTHGTDHMSFTVAKKAVDFYISQNHFSENDLAVGFYGGEPLLRFGLICKVIEYIKSLDLQKNVTFNFTTNGTLFTDEIIKFCIENKISLLISLDGPQEDHDLHRLVGEGQGSFKKVMNNVKKILDADTDYFMTNVSFNCVITRSSDLGRLNDFFTSHPQLFRPGHLTVSGMTEGHSTFFKNFEENKNQGRDLQELYQLFCDAHANHTNHNALFASEIYEKPLVSIHKRLIRKEPLANEIVIPTCFPGSRKVFVTGNGNCHICERINHHFPIGNVFTGYNVARITSIMNEYNDLMNSFDCKNCEAFRFCNFCFASLAGDGKFLQSIKDEQCEQMRQSVRDNLFTYCDVWSQNEHAWDYMDDITLS